MTKKIDKSRHSSTLAFLDFLFNLVLSFVLLFILVLITSKMEETKNKTVEDKNEFIISAQWNEGSNDDVDLWLQDPSQNVVGFFRREGKGMFLQRDDTGRAGKTIMLEDGSTKEELLNQEIVNIRAYQPGRYTINLHMFRFDHNSDATVKVEVKIIKVNPYQELPPVTIEFARSEKGAEKTVLNFTLDESGKITSVTKLPVPFVVNGMTSQLTPGESPSVGVN